jgi:hypothetical protein
VIHDIGPGVGTLSLSRDELFSKINMSEKEYDNAPVWKFEEIALLEIDEFMTSLTDDEYTELCRTVKVPKVVHMWACKNGKCAKFGTFIDARKYPDIDTGSSGFVVVINPHDFDENNPMMASVTTIATNAVVVRCLFRDRYVEHLTKHQERIIRRTGQLSASEPRIIRIAWDAPTPRYTYDRKQREEAERRKVCQHEVHGFLRHLRSGKTVWVRGHMRGDPNVERKTIYQFTGSRKGKKNEHP